MRRFPPRESQALTKRAAGTLGCAHPQVTLVFGRTRSQERLFGPHLCPGFTSRIISNGWRLPAPTRKSPSATEQKQHHKNNQYGCHIHFFTSSLSNTVLMASTVQIEGQSGNVSHAKRR